MRSIIHLFFIEIQLTCLLQGLSGKRICLQCRGHGRRRHSLWSGRCPRGGHGNSLQYSCLENSKDRGAWQATLLTLYQRLFQVPGLTHLIPTTMKIRCYYFPRCKANDPSWITALLRCALACRDMPCFLAGKLCKT